MDDDFDPAPDGIVRCLQALAEEAACLSLRHTFAALQEAIATCREESETTPLGRRSSFGAGLVH